MSDVRRMYAYGFAIPRPQIGTRRQWDISEAFMDADLAKSGLVAEDIRAYPVFLNMPKGADAAYVIPYYGLDGKVLASEAGGVTGRMCRIRCRYPSTMSRVDMAKAPKYTQPARFQIGEEATMPYILPSWWKVGSGVRYICEGEKKGAALWKRTGVGVMAIAGCANWHHTDPRERGRMHEYMERALEGVESVVIIPDGDIRRMQVGMHYGGLVNALERYGVKASILDVPADVKLDDWLAEDAGRGLEDVEEWGEYDIRSSVENKNDLVREFDLHHKVNREGFVTEIRSNDHNATQILRRHKYFRGAYQYDMDRLRIRGCLDVDMYDPARIYHEPQIMLQHQFHMQSLSAASAKAAVQTVAAENKVYPIRDWLNGLVWDGVERLEDWMIDYMGCEDTEFVREVSVKALVAAVARRVRPGCKVDYMVILLGPQGVGKSGVISALFGENNTLEYVRGGTEGKDMLIAWHSKWCVSDEELGHVSRSEMNKLKGIITVRDDEFRMPYAAESQRHPRQFVLWGSTNDRECIPQDDTGHRRFVVVETGADLFNFAGLEEVREQLWAEAVAVYREGQGYSNIFGASEVAASYVAGYQGELEVRDALEEIVAGKGMKMEEIKYKGEQYIGLKMLDLLRVCDLDTAQWRLKLVGVTLLEYGFEKIPRIRVGGVMQINYWLKRVTP